MEKMKMLEMCSASKFVVLIRMTLLIQADRKMKRSEMIRQTIFLLPHCT